MELFELAFWILGYFLINVYLINELSNPKFKFGNCLIEKKDN